MSKPEDLATNGPSVASLKRSDLGEADLALTQSPSEFLATVDAAALGRLLDSLATSGASPKAQRLVIKAGRRLVFLDIAEIDWIEASGNYVKFHVGRDSYIVRSGIGQIADRLYLAEFVRIHRSTVVNAKKIKELEPCDNGEYIVVLKDGKHLSCSRGYGARLQQLIRNGYSL
jgi:two-component system LytT family response regulator